MNYWLLLVPLLTAFTGWIVIRLLIWLLFRPMHPQKVLGIRWQGIIPAQKQQMSRQLGKFAALEFANFSGLEQKISDPKNFDNVKPMIESHIDDFLRNKLPTQMPMISMFIGDKTISSLKTIFILEIETLFPQVMQQFAGNLKNDLNIEQIITSKINALPAQKWEQLLHENLAKEFRLASGLGAAIGLLIGLIQLLILVYIS